MAVHQRKIAKFLGLYNTGRPSNSRLGLRSPNFERNKVQIARNASAFTFTIVVIHYHVSCRLRARALGNNGFEYKKFNLNKIIQTFVDEC